MPKKRSTSWSRIKKEKQIITARLIEISMKLEDCIYKQKPISGWEAEKYIREVSSFKAQCSRDERSLQVIEKLTRCMKAIILDKQEPAIHTRNESISIPADVVRAGSLSPVYSIPEEDRSRLTQIAERANENIEIIDLSNIDDDDDSMLNETNNATAGYTVSKEAVDVDIHRDMSSLSLRDLREPLDIEMSTDTNCSQSILNNFEGVEQMQQNTINITSQRAVADNFVGNVTGGRKAANLTQPVGKNSIDKPDKNVKTTLDPTKPIIICVPKNNLKLNTVVQNKEPIKFNNAPNYIKNVFNQKNETFKPVTSNIPEIQRHVWQDSNRTCTINDLSHSLKHTNHSTPPRQICKDINQVIDNKVDTFKANIPRDTFNTTEKENQPIKSNFNSETPQQNNRPISTINVIKENTATTKKKRGPKKKINDEKEIKQKKKTAARVPKTNNDKTTTKNKIIPIYNTNVVDDLSWIENIRYVREIKADENDSKLHLDESFWDNFYLPANWTENEFM